ncbi:MAG: hypothetical protein ACYSW8_32840, partial [Planctomycetota bacterium]
FLADDYDTTISYYDILVTEDDLFIGPDTDIDSLKYVAATNRWDFTNGSLYIGIGDGTYGRLRLAGHAAGQAQGGTLYVYCSADHDGTIDYYSFKAQEDDLYIGPATDDDSLKYEGSSNSWQVTAGDFRVGTEDVTADYGSITVYGMATGQAQGGRLLLHPAADYDTTITSFNIMAYQDDLYLGPNTDADALKYLGNTGQWDFSSSAGIYDSTTLNITGDTSVDFAGGGWLRVGTHDTFRGQITLYGSSTTNGGSLVLQTPADADDTINYYQMQAVSDDLYIGPVTDVDALKYDGGAGFWQMTAGLFRLGSDDTVNGSMYLYGAPTTTGGSARFYTAADSDGTIDYYSVQVSSDDLLIGPDTDTNAIAYLGADNSWRMYNGTLYVGQNAVTRGIIYLDGDPTGNDGGGFIGIKTADDHDTTIVEFEIQAYQDDLYIGPNTDTDALKYDGGLNEWIFSASAGTQFADGIVYVGASDTTQGQLRLYSDATGSDIGGALWLYVNPDYDATVNHYVIDVTQDDLNIGPSDFEGSLKYLASVNQWRFGEGEMSVGSPDTTRGTIYAYGQATGSTNGGRLLCYTAVDHDTTIDYYILQATSDDFTIGPITDTDALKYDGGTGNWWMTNADLLVMNTTQGYAQLLVGNDGDHRGSVNIFGNATGSTNGGQIRLYLADDHDGTIAEYKINVLSD